MGSSQESVTALFTYDVVYEPLLNCRLLFKRATTRTFLPNLLPLKSLLAFLQGRLFVTQCRVKDLDVFQKMCFG